MPEGEVGEKTAELATGEVGKIIAQIVLFVGGEMKFCDGLFDLGGFSVDGFENGEICRGEEGEDAEMDVFNTEGVTFKEDDVELGHILGWDKESGLE